MSGMASDTDALVVDASVAAKWYLVDEVGAEAAKIVLTRFSAGTLLLLAPNYIRYEVPAVLTVASLGGAPRITRGEAKRAINDFLALGLRTVESDDLISLAHDLSHDLKCVYYDALYLAVSQRFDTPFITADRRLYERIRHLSRVIWLGRYRPGSVERG